MVNVPMLADFGVRISFGLVLTLLVISRREVPPRFFRVQDLIALGILVLAALAQAGRGGTSGPIGWVIASAGCVYIASVAWGLGLPPIAAIFEAATTLLAVGWMIQASRGPDAGDWAWAVADRASSGLLLGATLGSMLLGHHYLVAPAMSIAPLKRALDLIGVCLAVRVAMATAALVANHDAAPAAAAGAFPDLAYLVMRWGMGFIGAGISVFLARRTAAIRSTQSATGILYITTTFVLFGELAAMAPAAGTAAG